jgi:hypothetical protein
VEVKILITSPPDRENLVAEIWVDDCQLAEVSQEGGSQLVEIYPHPRGGPWRLSFQQLQEAMKEARTRLAEVEGRVLRD